MTCPNTDSGATSDVVVVFHTNAGHHGPFGKKIFSTPNGPRCYGPHTAEVFHGGASRVRIVYWGEPATARTALRMWSVTACGWEIMITREPSTSTMSAPAR